MRPEENNRSVYQDTKVVREYQAQDKLFPSESVILSRLGPDLGRMAMLDIGIGGGRTTAHFQDKAREYQGIDYSAPMVEACRERFPGQADRFLIGDVRKLDFPDHRFDFILFSYNGLDYIPHAERLLALREMRRVGKPGAWVAFSTHNLLSLGTQPGNADGQGGWADLKRRGVLALMRVFNGNFESLKKQDHALIRDDGAGFRLRTYYIRPAAQIRQAEEAGLLVQSIFTLEGRELGRDQVETAADSWLYFLARIHKP